MAVSLVGSVFATSATPGTLPAHQAGDLLIGIAYRGSSTVPGMPSGWTAVQQATATNTSIRVASFIATGPGTSGGTWPSAGKVLVLVYRNAAVGAGNTASDYSGSSSWTSPALTLSDTSGGSWVLTSAAFNSLARVGTLPSGLTAIPGMDGTVPAGHTGAGVTSYAEGTGTISASSYWASVSLEIVATSVTHPVDVATDVVSTVDVTATVARPVEVTVGVVSATSTAAAVLTSNAVTFTVPAAGGVAFTARSRQSVEVVVSVASGSTVTATVPYTFTAAPRPLTSVAAGSHRAHVRLAGVAGPAAGVVVPVTAGTLTLDVLADVRAQLDVTVAGVAGWDPVDAASALDVRSGSEFDLHLGVEDDVGVVHWTQMAVVRPSNPRMSRSGAGVQITCQLDDRAWSVKLASIDRSWTIPQGTGLLAGVRDALAYVAPWLPVELDLAQDLSAGMDVPVAAEPGEDVWQRAREIVATLGRDLHVAPDGVVRAPMVTDPLAADPIMVPVTGWQDTSDTKDLANAWGVQWVEPRPEGAPTGWVPAAGWEWAIDAASIAQVGKRVRVVKDSSIATPDHARLVAQTRRVNAHDLTHAASCTAVAHPDLTLGAVILDPVRGARHRVTGLRVDLASGATDVTLGAPAPSWGQMLAQRPAVPFERDELVMSIDPLTSRPVAEPEGAVTLVEWTAAVKGVAVNDVIRVRCEGASRVAVGSRTVKQLADRDAGEPVASIRVNGGPSQSVTVGGTTDLTVASGSRQAIASHGLKPQVPFNFSTFTDLATATSAANQILQFLRDFDSFLRASTTRTS